MVSRNTPKIPHNPCLTGSRVSDALCAITELPRPASLEKIPRARPYLIARIKAYPKTPPPTALILKALEKIIPSAAGICFTLINMIISAIIMKDRHIKGTIIDAILPILFTPPIIISAISTATISPVAHAGMEKPPSSVVAIVFTCTIFIPKDASMQNTAKSTASHLSPSPSSI